MVKLFICQPLFTPSFHLPNILVLSSSSSSSPRYVCQTRCPVELALDAVLVLCGLCQTPKAGLDLASSLAGNKVHSRHRSHDCHMTIRCKSCDDATRFDVISLSPFLYISGKICEGARLGKFKVWGGGGGVGGMVGQSHNSSPYYSRTLLTQTMGKKNTFKTSFTEALPK